MGPYTMRGMLEYCMEYTMSNPFDTFMIIVSAVFIVGIFVVVGSILLDNKEGPKDDNIAVR